MYVSRWLSWRQSCHYIKSGLYENRESFLRHRQNMCSLQRLSCNRVMDSLGLIGNVVSLLNLCFCLVNETFGPLSRLLEKLSEIA